MTSAALLATILNMYYELSFLTHPQLDEKGRVTEEAAVVEILTGFGGTVEQAGTPENRPLGYGIKKLRQAWLHTLVFTLGDARQLNELPSKLKLRDQILRFTLANHLTLPDFAKIRSTLAAARAESKRGHDRPTFSAKGVRRAKAAAQSAEKPLNIAAQATATIAKTASKQTGIATETAPKKRRKVKNIDETIAAIADDKVEV